MPITRAIPDHELRAWADRMHDALEEIAQGLEEYIEGEGGAGMGPHGAIVAARRALNPDEWERTEAAS